MRTSRKSYKLAYEVRDSSYLGDSDYYCDGDGGDGDTLMHFIAGGRAVGRSVGRAGSRQNAAAQLVCVCVRERVYANAIRCRPKYS